MIRFHSNRNPQREALPFKWRGLIAPRVAAILAVAALVGSSISRQFVGGRDRMNPDITFYSLDRSGGVDRDATVGCSSWHITSHLRSRLPNL